MGYSVHSLKIPSASTRSCEKVIIDKQTKKHNKRYFIDLEFLKKMTKEVKQPCMYFTNATRSKKCEESIIYHETSPTTLCKITHLMSKIFSVDLKHFESLQ